MREVTEGKRSRRFRTLVLIALGVLLVLFLSASGLAQLYTDWLWFDHLGLRGVWNTVIGTQIALAFVFTAAFFLLLWGNLTLAERLAPKFRPDGPEEDLIERYHDVVGPHAGKIRIGVSALFALVAGLDTSGEWETWLLFRNGGEFGWRDPLFDRDAGFYIFELPFWTFLIDFFFASLVFALLMSLIAHYLNGGIRASAAPAERFTNGVKLHLSAMLAVLATLRAVAYWFDRYELVNSKRGVFDGALATDVEVQLPALQLLALISLFGAALFVANVWRKGWGLPLVAMGLWAISHVAIGSIYPSLYQRLRVVPEQSTREAEFIEHNIAATRFAYGLDEGRLTQQAYEYEPTLTAEGVTESALILDDVALVDAELATEPFTRSQGERQSYQFADRLDIGRYLVDGDVEPVVMSVRGLNLSGVRAGWESQHVAFTHGYGVAVARGDSVVEGGQPDYLVSGIGPDQTVTDGFSADLTQPQVYFSEDFGGYAIIDTNRDEVDYPSDIEAPFRYDGEGGVPIGSLGRRIAFSLRFQELNPLISNFLTDDSRVIYNRDVEDRVRLVAPFLEFDSDPYPIVHNGRVVWMIDGYTTTDNFPYSQSVSASDVGGDLRSGYNYVRESVKAVVDGYDGTVTMYVIDDEDPLIAAWQKSFPSLFRPVSELPAGLDAHFRYPADLFKVQTSMWATYQVTNPVQFLQGDLAWAVASQPPTNASSDAAAAATSGTSMRPQYRVTVLPGETEPEFIVQRAFVPQSTSDSNTERPELTSVLVARSDPGHYGELILYKFPTGRVPAPDLVNSDILKESEISEYITPLDLQGSTVLFGEMQMVLMADTVVYIRPLYVEAQGSTAVPELNRVIAVNGERIAMDQSLEAAIAAVTVDAPPVQESDDDDDEPSSNTSDPPAVDPEFEGMSVVDLILSADALLDRADVAERNGDADEAARLRADAQAALNLASELLGGQPASRNSEDSGEA